MRNFFTILFIIPLTFSLSFAQSVDITIQVNMEYETADPAGVFVAGGAEFGSPGDYGLTNTSGSIWEITLTRPVGFSSFYTITNGACPDYSCKENLAGQACGDPANFNDRLLMPVYSDTTLMHCFGQCTDDLSCTPPAAPVDIVFQVDMSQTTVLGPVYVTGGSLDNWCGTCLEMTDSDGDMIYRDTLSLTPGTYEFKFNNGGWDGTEGLDPMEDSDCTITTGNYTNRIVTIGAQAEELTPYCFNACTTCTVDVQNPEESPSWFALQPTVTASSTWLSFYNNESRLVSVYSSAGQLVHRADVAANSSSYAIDVKDLSAGLYFVTVQSGNQLGTQKLLVR